MKNKSRENKRNTCLPRTFSLANMARICSYNENDNADNYLLLVNTM
jgi:hypothetical protein